MSGVRVQGATGPPPPPPPLLVLVLLLLGWVEVGRPSMQLQHPRVTNSKTRTEHSEWQIVIIFKSFDDVFVLK